MKNHKFQQVRVQVKDPGESVRFSAETDKQFARVRGIHISMPNDDVLVGTTLGLKINGTEIFDDAHEMRLITCGHQVAPNMKFFLFEENIEAGGSAIEGRVTDGGTMDQSSFPYEAKIYLWLVNDEPKTTS
ncbi:MAG: hypothetical protein ACK4WD_01330 [Flavobacteriales bacterium]|jgi:hypothetical protein